MRFSNANYGLLGCAAVVALAIGGCSSMSEAECQALDWRTIGYEDGVAGYSGNRIGQHRKACGKHGVTPNLSEYQAGREQGLREYCKPANAFRVGARGNGYNGVCPADMDEEFSAAYQSGRQLYVLRARVSNAAADLDSLRQELGGIEENMIRTAAEILNPTISHEHRAQLLLDTKRMAERKGEISTEIPRVQADLEHYRRELDAYRATLAYVE